MFGVIVEGQRWIDSEGAESWSLLEAEAIADSLEAIGYIAEIVRISVH